MHRTARWTSILAAAVASLGSAAASSAQVCAGYPTLDGQVALGARLSFPEGATSFGVEGDYNMVGAPAFFANVNLATPDDDDADSYSIFGVGAAYELVGTARDISPGLSICPVAAVNFSSVNDATTLTIPLGIGLGTNVTLENGPLLMPYVIPQFVLTRISGDDFDTVSENDFGIGGGVLARFGSLYAGAELGRVFSEGADVVFTIRGGLTLGSAQVQ